MRLAAYLLATLGAANVLVVLREFARRRAEPRFEGDKLIYRS